MFRLDPIDAAAKSGAQTMALTTHSKATRNRDAGKVQGRHPPAAVQPDRQGRVKCLSLSGFHEMAYTDWGPTDAQDTVVCVHGLTRQGRDFDVLAHDLAAVGYRVVCPDLVGRGQSDWLPNTTDYVFPQYCADMSILLASLNAKRLHWVGTSLGGLIGMVLAAAPGSPIGKLVLNDIGPQVPLAATMRVSARLLLDPQSFASMAEAEHHMRRIYAACGPLTDEQWRHLTVHSFRQEDGRLLALLDPKVRFAFQWYFYYQMSMWSYWEKLSGPVMLVHGAQSDFVPAGLVRTMRRTVPQLRTHEVAQTGHMPSLMTDQEVSAIRSFMQTPG